MGEAAPLYATPQAPGSPSAPAGGTAEWVEAAPGRRLRAALFPPTGAARGSVVLSPGYTEVIEKYFEVVGELQGRGFAVLVHDWMGQGLSGRLSSDPRLGHAVGWRPYLDDYNALLAQFGGRLPKPWIAVGHSMGGGLTTLALVETMAKTTFAAAVLSAPMLGLQLGGRAPASTLLAARVMGLVGRGARSAMPQTDPLHAAFDANVLTHDEARFDRTLAILKAHPELALGGPSWSWLAFALALVARLERDGAMQRIAIPYTVVLAGEERLVDNAALRRATARAPKGRLVEVDGAFHELLMETDPLRAQFWAAFDETVDAVAPPR